jgi:L-iditol 2-dehydrogenase
MRPTSTTAAVYHASGDLRLEELPLPPLQRGEMLIRVGACGLCPGEIMDWYMQRKAPVPLGHEPVGEVIDVTDGVPFRPGDRVFVHHHAPCLVCRSCARGDFVHCPTWRPRRLVPGGLATHAIVQPPAVAADTMRVPDELSDDIATFVEPLACVVKSLRRARVREDDRVLVIGLGVMGLLHLLAVRAVARPGQLLAADRVPERLAAGSRIADVTIDTSGTTLDDGVARATGDAGADVVIVCPGSVEALEAGLRVVAPGGTLAIFAPTAPGVLWPLPVHDLFFRETTLVPSYSAGPTDTREAMRLLVEGLPVESLITHRLPLSEAARGYALVRSGGAALKVIVRP